MYQTKVTYSDQVRSFVYNVSDVPLMMSSLTAIPLWAIKKVLHPLGVQEVTSQKVSDNVETIVEC